MDVCRACDQIYLSHRVPLASPTIVNWTHVLMNVQKRLAAGRKATGAVTLYEISQHHKLLKERRRKKWIISYRRERTIRSDSHFNIQCSSHHRLWKIVIYCFYQLVFVITKEFFAIITLAAKWNDFLRRFETLWVCWHRRQIDSDLQSESSRAGAFHFNCFH